MIARDSGVLKDDILVGLATDSQGKAFERNGALVETIAQVKDQAGSELGSRFSGKAN
jgi:hypothetical protein